MATTSTNGNAASASTESAKKQMKAFVNYVVPASGDMPEKAHNYPQADATIVRTEFSNGVKRDIDVTKLKADVLACATLQGIATRTQRGYQALKEIDAVIEAYDDTANDLLNGVWIESRSGEPKVTMLSQAIVLSLEASGQTVDEARRLSIIEKLKNADNREKAMANEHVKMHLANLKLEAAKARAAEAKKAVKDGGSNVAPASALDF